MAFFRVSQQGHLPQGDQWVSNFHMLSSATTAAVHTAADSGIQSFWNNTAKAMMPAGWGLDAIVTTELDPATGKNLNAQVSSHTIVGTVGAASPPPQACVLFSYRTANAGKHGRGRQYFPSVAITHLKPDGSLVDADRDTLDTAWTAVLTGLNTTGTPIILHGGYDGRDATGKPIYKNLTSDAITTIAVATGLATQRRRVNRVARSYSPFLAV